MPFLGRAKLFLIAVYTMIDCVVSKNFIVANSLRETYHEKSKLSF